MQLIVKEFFIHNTGDILKSAIWEKAVVYDDHLSFCKTRSKIDRMRNEVIAAYDSVNLLGEYAGNLSIMS